MYASVRAKKILTALRKLGLDAKTELNYSKGYELLFAVILSAQATDKKVNEVTKKLFKKYKTLLGYAKARQNVFEKDIARIGLYRAKAKNIISSAKILREKYNGKIPRTIDELIKLPGVGRKTANVILWNLYGTAEGVVVDTHVTRIARLFGLTKHKEPKKIEADLMRALPKSNWGEFGALLVHYGRYHCHARCTHDTCPIRRFIAKA